MCGPSRLRTFHRSEGGAERLTNILLQVLLDDVGFGWPSNGGLVPDAEPQASRKKKTGSSTISSTRPLFARRSARRSFLRNGDVQVTAVPKGCATFAEVLNRRDTRLPGSAKTHNVPTTSTSPAGPNENLADQRGFELYFYGFIAQD